MCYLSLSIPRLLPSVKFCDHEFYKVFVYGEEAHFLSCIMLWWRNGNRGAHLHAKTCTRRSGLFVESEVIVRSALNS